MPAHFAITFRQVLWTLSFASHLVLLVVLFGRHLARRYPFFTAATVLLTLRLLAEDLLAGRIAMLTLQEIYLTFADLSAVLALAVAAELLRHAFAGASRAFWQRTIAALTLVTATAMGFWRPWLGWQQIAPPNLTGTIRMLNCMVLWAAPRGTLLVSRGIDKGNLLGQLLLLQVGVLILVLGRRYQAPLRSHTQKLALGLAALALVWLGTQLGWQIVVSTIHIQSRAQYDSVMALGGRLINTCHIANLIAVLWWIGWLWFEQAQPSATLSEPLPAPADLEASGAEPLAEAASKTEAEAATEVEIKDTPEEAR